MPLVGRYSGSEDASSQNGTVIHVNHWEKADPCNDLSLNTIHYSLIGVQMEHRTVFITQTRKPGRIRAFDSSSCGTPPPMRYLEPCLPHLQQCFKLAGVDTLASNGAGEEQQSVCLCVGMLNRLDCFRRLCTSRGSGLVAGSS